MLDFRHNAEGAILYKAMCKARDALSSAQLNYLRAFESALGDDVADGIYRLRQQGRDYARAVSQYSNAVMAWLAYVDVWSKDAGKSASA